MVVVSAVKFGNSGVSMAGWLQLKKATSWSWM